MGWRFQMKFYFKTLLPYILMLFANFYVVKYAFKGMTYPNDLTYMGGFLAIAAIAVADGIFIVRKLKKLIVVHTPPPDDDPTPKS
jgi:hypothetical protein